MIPVSKPSIGTEELKAIEPVFKSGWLGMGSVVKEFEDAIAAFIGGEPLSHVVAVNTGTTAMHIALSALGVGAGDEVVIPSLTFVATAQIVTATGANPVFCEIEEDTLNIDVNDLERCITEKTKAIIPVHYRGIPCNMNAILKLARDNNIAVIEDAAHALGSSYYGKKIGSFGDITCFSFDPIKTITCGEGGAVITRDKKIYESMVRKRILGIDKDTWSRYKNERSWSYDVIEQGYRYHMSNINAAIGLVQIKKFEQMNKRKIDIAKRYDEEFAHMEGLSLLRTGYEDIGLFTYIIKVKNRRDELMVHLKEKGIGSGIHYIPVHHFTYYKNFLRNSLPITDKVYEQILTLPLYPDMTDEETDLVIKEVLSFFSKN
ncbi:MAG: DegT/DnrJ/EryC1/StrS aminotransferase family protein [Candidatus Brocadiales bacterium]|nr:DegT/DnrJ/EryC1/StrS aminotransferase family protein [Candidatus Brocadiales bacterium]